MRILIAGTLGATALLFVLRAETARADLQLQYNFDEADSGDTAALDLGAAPPAPGTFQGGATRTANTPGGSSLGAADLSAANTYVTTTDADKLDGLGPLTLSAWVNLQGNPAHGNRVMSKQVPSGNFDGFSFAFNNSTAGTIAADNFRLNLALGGTGGFGFFVSDQDLNAANDWVFVAVTYDGAGGITFYSGGDESGANAASIGGSLFAGVANPGSLVDNTMDFRVGAQSAGTISPPVWIDDVRVYDEVLDLAALEAVRLENISDAGLDGDFNGDGSVDAADYVTWRKGLGTTHTLEQYDEWRTNFGTTAPGGGSSATAAPTPEPSTAMMTVIAGLAAAFARRKVRD